MARSDARAESLITAGAEVDQGDIGDLGRNEAVDSAVRGGRFNCPSWVCFLGQEFKITHDGKLASGSCGHLEVA